MVTTGRVSRCRFSAVVMAAAMCVGLGACSQTSPHPPTDDSVTTLLPSSGSLPAPAPTTSTGAAAAPAPVAVPPTPAVPAVVALAWLDGPSTGPALRLPVGGIVRWQGSTSGEQAEMLPDGAYRWVGPDGSTVGCAVSRSAAAAGSRRLRCVGLDPEGDTAVTLNAGGPRTVYGPDGRLLGEFEPGGERVTVTGPSVTLAQAIAASGVDMASLVDFATRNRPFSGGVTGDVHLVTIGGVRVSTRKTGDFLARAGDQVDQTQIQIRTEPMPYEAGISYVSAAAVGVPEHRVELVMDGTLSIDGAPVPAQPSFHPIAMTGGPSVGLWPADLEGVVHAVILWGDGSTVSMSADPSLGLTVIARLPDESARGLFGDANPTASPGTDSVTTSVPGVAGGVAAGDFSARPPGAARSVDQVVESWRVPAAQSLFSESAPTAPAPSAPPPQASPVATVAARSACTTGSFANSQDMAACVFDVARTGDDGFVAHLSELATAAVPSRVPPQLALDWPALVLGSTSSPPDLSLGARIDHTVSAGHRQLYRLTLPAPARVSIEGGRCPGQTTGDEAGRGAPALRLFDDSGRPVSSRRSPCGHGRTDQLAAGDYYLVLAGPTSGADATFKVVLNVD